MLSDGDLVRVRISGVTATARSPFGESFAILWTDSPTSEQPTQLQNLFDQNDDLLSALKSKLSSFEYSSVYQKLQDVHQLELLTQEIKYFYAKPERQVSTVV